MAGRHKKNNADYFIHDKDMRHDRRIQALCKRFGQFKGYCIFNWLLEVLTDSSNFCVKWDSEEIQMLSIDFGIDETELIEMVNYMKKIHLISIENGYLFSPRLIKRLLPVLKHRSRNCKEIEENSILNICEQLDGRNEIDVINNFFFARKNSISFFKSRVEKRKEESINQELLQKVGAQGRIDARKKTDLD